MLLFKKGFLLSLGFGLSLISSAQIEDTTVEIPVFTVQGVKHDVDIKETPKHITVITQEEIEMAPVQNVAELLEYAVNIDMRTRGYFGTQSDVSLRGGSFDQTLIMINGVKVSDVQTGHHNMNIPVPVQHIESIQITHGGASRLYGPYAFAGAINIITKKEFDDQVSAGLSVGQNGLHGEQVALSKAWKNVSAMVSYDRLSGTGYIQNTDFTSDKVYSQVQFQKGGFRSSFQGGFNHNAFGAQNFYTAAFPDQYEQTRTFYGALVNEYSSGKNKFLLRLSGRRNYDRFELFREDPGYYQRRGDYFVDEKDTVPSWYGDHNYHYSDALSAEANYRRSGKWGKTSIGAEFRSETIYSSLLGDSGIKPIEVRNYPAYYAKSKQRNNGSIFIDHGYYEKRWSVSGGAMMNVNSDFGTVVYPGVEAAVWPLKQVKLRGSYSRSVRFPTFTDLYYNRGGAVGSINLRPEEADNYEVGVNYYGKAGLRAGVSAFIRDGRDLIDWIRYDGSAITQASNILAVQYRGIDADVSWNLKAKFGKEVWLERIGFNYMTLTANENSQGFTSAYALDFLNYKFHAFAAHKSFYGIQWQWRYTMQDRRGAFFDPVKGVNVDYKPFALLDLRIQKVWNDKITVFAEASNILDKTYYDVGNVQMPGRWIRGGVAVSLGY